MTIDATAGALTWSPTGADLGIHQVTVMAGASIHEAWLSDTPIGLDLTDARLVEHLERSLVDGETTHRCGTVSRPCRVARFADPPLWHGLPTMPQGSSVFSFWTRGRRRGICCLGRAPAIRGWPAFPVREASSRVACHRALRIDGQSRWNCAIPTSTHRSHAPKTASPRNARFGRLGVPGVPLGTPGTYWSHCTR